MAGWKTQVKTYGCVPSMTTAQAMDSRTKPKRQRDTVYRKKDQADICLKCTKKKCRGGSDCFNSRIKEQACAESGPSSET